jgi:hypothetical protein
MPLTKARFYAEMLDKTCRWCAIGEMNKDVGGREAAVPAAAKGNFWRQIYSV